MTAAQPLRLAVAGAGGRMGRMLVQAIVEDVGMKLSGALDVAGSPAIGEDAGAFAGRDTGARITADVAAGLTSSQVLIDFTRPEGTLAHLAVCRELGVKAVIGTTGFSDAQKALIEEIIEAHHRHKIDAPSGTALAMGEVVAAALGRELKDCAVYGREGVTGERDPSTIGFSSVRGGDIVGDHTVLFAGTGERIEINHRSSSRATYAQGSLRAARFVAEQASGLFTMSDVLGIS
jgi:4-hydroxy-tetrahydrodipicolinate reductase